ncbi:MAG: lysophospholipid acyltransferase family protein [Bacteroidales bacterium]|nr:lysophospholipid acyltransferase family protein [Bacteroidales bacterium]MCF8337494.1 lysophospholipid acyltransferase family protein [Bacteroidales bacterium]
MIKARHKKPYDWFFKWYSRWMIKAHFREMEIHGNVADDGNPILVIGNHFSWWDGFIMVEVNNRLWRRYFNVMMLEEQLENHMFLNKAGAFSIKKGERSLVESLAYSGELLSDSENLVLMFPQGEIQTKYTRKFEFEKGVETILKKSQGKPQVVFSAALIEYFSYRKPRMDVYLQKLDYEIIPSTSDLQDAYNNFFKEAVEKNNVDR